MTNPSNAGLVVLEIDLRQVLREVVEPCLSDLINPGELESLSIGWQSLDAPMPMDEVSIREAEELSSTDGQSDLAMVQSLSLILELTLRGEQFWLQLCTAEDANLEGVTDSMSNKLWDNLAEFISTSGFAWGEERPS